jgi:N-methylhydantoinase B
MTAFYIIDGFQYPPRGAAGGGDGTRSEAFKVQADGTEVPLPPISDEELAPGEVLIQHTSGGGGYGDPLERDPALVRADVLAGFVGFERARDVYGVVFDDEVVGESLTLDVAGTSALRDSMRGRDAARLTAPSA